MELKEAQISEIKNLKLIYVFSTDSIFENKSNKYIGAKVIFGNNQKFELDYKDKYFGLFIKRILYRYNKEKDKNKIILLGDLTQDLINNSSFEVLKTIPKKGIQTTGLPSFNTMNNAIKKDEIYLKEVIKMILITINNYETVTIDNIKGFNHKYVIEYTIGKVKKTLPIILYKKDNQTLEFKFNLYDNRSIPINGSIKNHTNTISINWETPINLSGYINYDAQNNAVEKKIERDSQTIYYDDNKDTIIDEDIKLINFYFELCNIQIPQNIIKTSDNSFIFSEDKNLNDNDNEILYSNISANLIVTESEVLIRYSSKNCFSKYNNQINVVLDEESEEITLRKIEIDNLYYILIERKLSSTISNDTYTHEVLRLNEDVNMQSIFPIQERYSINKETKTLEHVKQYIKHKGGKK